MTALQNVMEATDRRGREKREIVKGRALECSTSRASGPGFVLPQRLSGGQQQRVAIAGIAMQPN